jgi:transcription antitermination factor NusG
MAILQSVYTIDCRQHRVDYYMGQNILDIFACTMRKRGERYILIRKLLNEVFIETDFCRKCYLGTRQDEKWSIGIVIGDKIRIKSGLLIGMESMIKKIDRHGRNATIELNLLVDIRNVTVALEITAKI